MREKDSVKRVLCSRYHWFIAVVFLIKLIVMGLFSSDYQDKLFLPFVTDFIREGGNVYQRFYENGIADAFPYPIIMLLTVSSGAFLIEILNISSLFWVNFVFKIPSLIIDFISLNVLVRFFPNKRRYVAVFYYASPIVLYSVYMHGQLDLIPMGMLILALYFLTSKKDVRYRYTGGIVFTVLALLCKFHILAVLPIIFFYLQKRDSYKKAIGYVIGITVGVIIGVGSVWSTGFKELVLFNAEQSVLTQVSFSFATVELYIPIAAVLFIYLISFKISYMNRELFLNLCGIVFAVFLAFCPPMPGWYVWIVPFMALFFASINEEKYKNIVIYAGMNGLYLVYFLFLHSRQYVDLYYLQKDMSFIKFNNDVLSNGVFTLLSGVLIYLLISMYQLGVSSNNLYKRKNIPFTIGIAGDSGSGKSTLIDTIEKGLGVANLQYIEGDGDHRWERKSRFWDEYTALNPKANYLYRQADDLRELLSGSAVRRVDYDHSTGKFIAPKRIKPKKFVILCGLHALYLPQTRKNLDLKIYMDSDETLRRYWKIQRDTLHRGHTKEEVLKAIQERMPDAEKYIYPQKQYADLIVKYYDKNLKDCMVEKYEADIAIQLTLSAAINVEPIVSELRMYGIKVDYEYSDNLQDQYITFDADDMEQMHLPLERIADRVIPQLEEITRENLGEQMDAKDGIIILFLLLLISNKMQGVM